MFSKIEEQQIHTGTAEFQFTFHPFAGTGQYIFVILHHFDFKRFAMFHIHQCDFTKISVLSVSLW